MWIYRNSSLIRCKKVRSQIESPTWGHNSSQREHIMKCRAEFESAFVTACDFFFFFFFFCKFGFVDADSFRYFDNIYDPKINLIFKYLRHMVIHCERPDHIPWILWRDIHDLSQILHYPGNDSNQICFSSAIHVGISLSLPYAAALRFYTFPKAIISREFSLVSKLRNLLWFCNYGVHSSRYYLSDPRANRAAFTLRCYCHAQIHPLQLLQHLHPNMGFDFWHRDWSAHRTHYSCPDRWHETPTKGCRVGGTCRSLR